VPSAGPCMSLGLSASHENLLAACLETRIGGEVHKIHHLHEKMKLSALAKNSSRIKFIL
jgi:starvation-inducible outer membrane lipoprotein